MLFSRTFSLIWWMVALDGPNSMSSFAMALMKRPSEVPPVVDNSVSTPQISAMAARATSVSLPAWVRKGCPEHDHCKSYCTPCLSKMAWTRCFSPASVDSVEKRKLNLTLSSPGMTLVAPVPPLILEI
ncbi:Uncharacterised protein [Neisseria meningitidis]|nr:Uncharacterised protein [Neisseria meningitidis]